jgi:hypothetical protein
MSYEKKLTAKEIEEHNNIVRQKQLERAQKLMLEEGIKDDSAKPLLALIPATAIEEEGMVWTFGAKKYAKYNWCKGIAYSRILSATFRHLVAIMKGEDVDPESGLLHAAHIRCNMGMLIDFTKDKRKDLDDRHKK